MSGETQIQSERLKAEGNSLFLKRDFSGAYKKYSEAIKHDDQNAVLFCNRAACSIEIGRYIDASTDASKATRLDPIYAKAWGRLAAAQRGLHEPEREIEALEKAIKAFNTVEKLSPAEQKLRDKYILDLSSARSNLDDMITNPKRIESTVKISDSSQLPWVRAMAVLPTLNNNWRSSAWGISQSYREWEAAMQAMRQLVTENTSQGVNSMIGNRGVVDRLTNAIIADDRVFHVTDSNFLSLWNKQIAYETALARAWDDIGPQEVMVLASKRLAEEGWQSVQYALGVTIRAWIMRAFLEDRLRRNGEVSMEFLTSALEVLRWGQSQYQDVPYSGNGAIFQPTFIRGIECMRLNICLKTYKENSGPISVRQLDELYAGANHLLDGLTDAPTHPPADEDYAHFNSFYRYPLATGHAMRAFYHHEKAKLLRRTQGPSEEVLEHYREGNAEYLAAASFLPQDDEIHVWYLHAAVQCSFESVSKVRFIKPTLDKMHDTIPVMKRIWEVSLGVGPERDLALEDDMSLRAQIQSMLQEGVINMDTKLTKIGPREIGVVMN